MCKVRDVALAVLQKSIKLASERKSAQYYMDYVKLHKILYLGQCLVLSQYGITLFNENISAHHCGPYIEEELDFITAAYGFEPIRTLVDRKGHEPVFLPLPALRNEIVDNLLDKVGAETTETIVKMTKNTTAYLKHKEDLDDKPIITIEDMTQVGKELSLLQV